MKKLVDKLKGFVAYDLGILKKRFFWKTKKYLSKYYSLSDDLLVADHKTLIYMLDGRAYSGGISDIIKGVLSMYKFSKEIGYDFRINFCFPYNLQDYLEPNLYNWLISKNEISYNSDYSAYLWIYNSYLSYGKSIEFEIAFQKKILQNFIKENASKTQFHIYTNSEWARGAEYSVLFNELFKPAKPLSNMLNYHQNILGTEYISLTFRFQQSLGDFVEKNPSSDKTKDILRSLVNSEGLKDEFLPDFGELQLRAILGDFKNKKISIPLNDINKKALISSCIRKIIEIREAQYPEVKILITADSEIFLSEANKLDFVYVISSKEIHKVANTDKYYTVYLKAYIDILMLSEAKKLHLLYTQSMYRSGFAKNASFINNRDYLEINF